MDRLKGAEAAAVSMQIRIQEVEEAAAAKDLTIRRLDEELKGARASLTKAEDTAKKFQKLEEEALRAARVAQAQVQEMRESQAKEQKRIHRIQEEAMAERQAKVAAVRQLSDLRRLLRLREAGDEEEGEREEEESEEEEKMGESGDGGEEEEEKEGEEGNEEKQSKKGNGKDDRQSAGKNNNNKNNGNKLGNRNRKQREKQNPRQNLNPDPPAMAAPGFIWKLVREIEPIAAAGQGVAVAAAATAEDEEEEEEEGIRTPPILHACRDSNVGESIPSPSMTKHNASSMSYDAPAAFDHFLSSHLDHPTSSDDLTFPITLLKRELQRSRGDLATIRVRLKEAESARDHLAVDFLAAAAARDELEGRVKEQEEKAKVAQGEVQMLKTALGDVQRCYAAALELAGERDEQLEELRADMEDLKALYRQQISSILGGGNEAV